MPQPSTSRHLAHLPAFGSQPIVFLTATTDSRQRLLDNTTAHGILHNLWETSTERNGWFVGDYVLMPEHIHLFVRASQTAIPMREWIKLWKSMSARELCQQGLATAPVWQADYFDRYLRTAESYAEKWAYVRDNPVRAGLVKTAEEWPYQGRIHVLSA